MSDRADPAADFLSGDSGQVVGARRLKRSLGEGAFDLVHALALTGPRVDRLAADQPALRVLVLSIYRPGSLLPEALAQLRSSRHAVAAALGTTAKAHPMLADSTLVEGLEGGKLENLNRVLALAPELEQCDWALVVDDDVRIPRRFTDRFLALCEHFSLGLAQPAQTLRSHSAWRVTRRQPASLVRETRFVEVGPLTAFRREVASELMPFPPLRYAWGLDLHWAALARERGWRLGVVDATPVHHEHSPVATAYPRDAAMAEAARFLANRDYVRAAEAQRSLTTHRRLRG